MFSQYLELSTTDEVMDDRSSILHTHEASGLILMNIPLYLFFLGQLCSSYAQSGIFDIACRGGLPYAS